jgi:hypothetical protein
MTQQEFRDFWQQFTKTDKVNVNESERLASLLGGGLMALNGLTKRFPANIGSMGAGGYLIYRGLTGHCPAYEAWGYSTASRTEQLQFRGDEYPSQDSFSQRNNRRGKEVERTINPNNSVDQAVLDSFPASDPPAQSPIPERETHP